MQSTSGDRSALDPLRDCLPDLGVPVERIAVATAFTPQDPVSETQALRDVIMDPARIATRAPLRFERSPAWSRRRLRLWWFRRLPRQ